MVIANMKAGTRTSPRVVRSPHRFYRLQLKRRHLGWLAAFSVIILVKVWQTTSVDHLNRRNGVWAEELRALRYENLQLQAKIEELRSMERITRIARKELNMIEVPKIKLEDKNAFEKLTDQFIKTDKKDIGG